MPGVLDAELSGQAPLFRRYEKVVAADNPELKY